MARHAVVTFLEDRESLKGVDSEFRMLVSFLHRIPFCATFGVSCAGHFKEEYYGKGYTHCVDQDHTATSFWPEPFGSLNIIISPAIPHVQELLRILQERISCHSDTSFRKINHVFGPPENIGLEVWEIRIGDNGCLESLGEDYYGGYLSINKNRSVYKLSKKRAEEIQSFWEDLAKTVADFCRQQGFKRSAIQKRVKELENIWTINAANTKS